MPQSLRQILSRHLGELRAGIAEVRSQEFVAPSDRFRLEQIALQRRSRASKGLESRPKFAQTARDFGALAQAMFLLNLPEAGASRVLALDEAIARHSAAFRIVVYDAGEAGGSRYDMVQSLREMRQRRTALSERFAEIGSADLESASVSLDPRSPAFGVAALVYSHAINDTARAWLGIWQAANGDMSGQPLLGSQP